MTSWTVPPGSPEHTFKVTVSDGKHDLHPHILPGLLIQCALLRVCDVSLSMLDPGDPRWGRPGMMDKSRHLAMPGVNAATGFEGIEDRNPA